MGYTLFISYDKTVQIHCKKRPKVQQARHCLTVYGVNAPEANVVFVSVGRGHVRFADEKESPYK